MNIKGDFFKKRADDYDETVYRLRYVDEMAKAIRRSVSLDRTMHLMDFGAGTGLLTERIAPYVGSITAVDISDSMIGKLRQKISDLPCRLTLLRRDLCDGPLPDLRVDGIISTMTLHHIGDVPALFRRLGTLLRPGGFVAFCDIDREDGSFHTIDTGVKHLGFDREEIANWLRDAGFAQVRIGDAATIRKPQGEYPAFLLTGIKPERG